jgi:hypothetical protein
MVYAVAQLNRSLRASGTDLSLTWTTQVKSLAVLFEPLVTLPNDLDCSSQER